MPDHEHIWRLVMGEKPYRQCTVEGCGIIDYKLSGPGPGQPSLTNAPESVQEMHTLPEPLPVAPKRRGRPPKAVVRDERTADETALRVHVYPPMTDNEVGGIPRVIEGQVRNLGKFGIDLVDSPDDADVICCHVIIPETYLKLYPEKTFVVVNHGLYWGEFAWGNAEAKTNAQAMDAIRAADASTAPTEWVANSLRRNTSRHITVIPHGVDAAEWATDPHDHIEYVLWNKSRPDPVCDPQPMNDVAGLLPGLQFISTFGVETPNVKLTGSLPYLQARELVRHAAVYLATTRETFGVGTLEAMASGCPVVGFRWGGQAEFIEHKRDGYLVTPGDMKGLAEGIKWALANRAEVGRAAAQKAATFTWERAASMYADLFRKTHSDRLRASPRTSVIVTNYNLHDYLDDCLASVAAQTDQDFECIVVDDASSNPAGREIARAYANRDPRFRLIENATNQYLAEARNVGIRAATGRYILPLDADDMLTPNAVGLLAGYLDRDRRIHVAYGGVSFRDEDGRTPTVYSRNLPAGHSGWPIQFALETQILQRNMLPYCSMFRRTAWEQTGGYRRRCRTAEDADMWTRLASYGFRPAMVTQEDTLTYRNRPDSMSRQQGDSNWIRWFPWARVPEIVPAGASTQTQQPVPSLDPIVISVVIPVGPGHEKLVTDAIDSVDAQTFRNWEVIVVNDTGAPLATELPAWVRVIESEGATGPAHARNLGIEASRGQLFLPLDADDYLEPQALEAMWNAYRDNPGTVIYSDFWQTDDTGEIAGAHQCDNYDPHLLTGGARTVEGHRRQGMIHSVTALTPKRYWEQIGGYDESLSAWEDWDFQLALGNIGACSLRVASPLFVYRKHTGFRREANYAEFEKSKESILNKWRDLWEGGKELMACGRCGVQRSLITQGQSIWDSPGMLRSQPSGVMASTSEPPVLIQYIGDKMGSTPYKGPSGTVYWFGGAEPAKYVLAQDVPMLLSYDRDFKVADAPPAEASEPDLVADGAPA